MDINELMKKAKFESDDFSWRINFRVNDLGYCTEIGIEGDKAGPFPAKMEIAQHLLDNFKKYYQSGLKYLKFWIPDTEDEPYELYLIDVMDFVIGINNVKLPYDDGFIITYYRDDFEYYVKFLRYDSDSFVSVAFELQHN